MPPATTSTPRVAYTLEQCWHRVPGGTAVAALRVAERLVGRDDVDLIGVAGRHSKPAPPPWRPPLPVQHLPLAAPLLYDAWLRVGWPPVERASGPVDVAHATTIIPCPSRAPLVATVHDLAWMHRPDQFTRRGVAIFRRSLALLRRRAALLLCSSQATLDDCLAAGFGSERLRHVPLGVDALAASPADVERVRRRHDLPDRYLLFVGTVEPRKNLRRLAAAVARLDEPLPLVVAGATGWGDSAAAPAPGRADLRFLGFVDTDDLAGLYAGAAAFCYPSEREGYGLPVLEAMAQATPVVTSRGTATEEAAGGAAVLVDPADPDDIARGITEALSSRDALAAAGRRRAATATWEATAALTVAAYRDAAR